MEKAKNVLTVILMLYIFVGTFIILYYLLVWSTFLSAYAYTLLASLLLLKGIIITIQHEQPVEELCEKDKINLKTFFLISVNVFLVTLFISYLFNGRIGAALVTVLLSYVLFFRNRLMQLFNRAERCK
jgi:hypothetical protein